jgi:predicted nucleic acid-binding protein
VIKLLVVEPGSELIEDVFDRSANASTSALAYVEATSALARMRKGGRLSTTRRRSALRDLDELWDELDVSSVTNRLIEAASQAANHYALRAYDSLHLATALSVAEVERIAFACWDRELREAARARGLPLIPSQI